jgi:hypothetical protein
VSVDGNLEATVVKQPLTAGGEGGAGGEATEMQMVAPAAMPCNA